MFALISPIENVFDFEGNLIGVRIAQVGSVPFDVAPPLFWVECPDNTSTDLQYFDMQTSSFQDKPLPPVQNLEDQGAIYIDGMVTETPPISL
jgi:hypothetical protein